MVKPRWSKTESSLYMLNDLKARDNAAIIGMVLDTEKIDSISAGNSAASGADTTITGKAGGQLSYKSILATQFGMFGVFSDKPQSVADSMFSEMTGKQAPRVMDAKLRSLRLA